MMASVFFTQVSTAVIWAVWTNTVSQTLSFFYSWTTASSGIGLHKGSHRSLYLLVPILVKWCSVGAKNIVKGRVRIILVQPEIHDSFHRRLCVQGSVQIANQSLLVLPFCEWKVDCNVANDEEAQVLITQLSFMCPIVPYSLYDDVIESLSIGIVTVLWEPVDIYRHKVVRAKWHHAKILCGCC